tara:strand:+ start:89 stop:496 length:408 start_codon:yes stop_codon:yes gene_type:complete
MDNKDGTYPNDVGSIEPIPIGERTPVLDMLPNNIRNALQGIGGLMDDPMIAMPGGFARMPLKKLLQELAQRKALYKQHGERYRRAAQVKQSAIRDGYNPDIVGSEKIMNNANNIGKQLKKEMDELQNLINKNGNT